MRYYILKNNDCCTYKEILIFKSRKELKASKEFQNSDFYDFVLTSKKKIKGLARTDYELEAIQNQLI